MVSGQFLNIGNMSKVKLEDFIPVGSSTVGYGDIVIRTLGPYGGATAFYTWDPDWENDNGTTGAWLTGDGEEEDIATGVTFAPGTGLWVQGVTGVSLQTSGKVSSADIIISLTTGSIAIGNPFPVTINLNDIAVIGSPSYGDIVIRTLGPYGGATAFYTWDPDWENDNGTTGAWLTGEGADEDVATGVTFNGGEGLWVQGVAGVSLQFPAPEGL